MDIANIISKVSPDFLIFLLTSFFAFIAWLLKKLLEKPIEDSKKTFNQFFQLRIDILTKIKVRLCFLAYFPNKEGLKYKEDLQKILLEDNNTAYLNKSTLDDVLKIAIDTKTNEILLFKVISDIEQDLTEQITKIQDETRFYINFSNLNPTRRFFGIGVLFLQYLLSFAMILFLCYFMTLLFLNINLIGKILLFTFISIISLWGNKIITKIREKITK